MPNKDDIQVKVNFKSQKIADRISSEIFYTQHKRVKKATHYLKRQIKKAMSVKIGFTGHPYAKHQFPHRIDTGAISPNKRYEISSRSGDLVSGVRMKVTKDKTGKGLRATGIVYHTFKPTKYAPAVFLGSKIMFGRNPFTGVGQEPEVREEIKRILLGG